MTRRLFTYLRRAATHPLHSLAVLRRDRLRLFLRGAELLPVKHRRRVGRLVIRLSVAFSSRSRRDGRGATARSLGLWLAGRHRDAASMALLVCRNPRTSPHVRLELARLCLRAHAYDAAAEALADPSNERALGAERYIFQARLDRARFHHEDAVEASRRAIGLAPGDKRARGALARSLSQRNAWTPGWRPSLPPPAHPVEPVSGRILHIVSNALPALQNGYTIRTQSIARAQLDVGLHPVVAAAADGLYGAGLTALPRQWQVDGVPYHLVDSGDAPPRPSDRERAKEAILASRIVEEMHPAVLHPATPHRDVQIAMALRDRYGLPIVYEVRGFREESWMSREKDAAAESAHHAVLLAIDTECMRQADAIVTLSEGMREEIVARGIDAARITVIPNAVDVESFSPLPRDVALAGRLGLNEEPVIGYISSFAAYEGIPTLIRATAELRRRGRAVRCLIVGDGLLDEREELEALARASGVLDGTVIFTGRVPHGEVRSYYSLIDVFVVPRTDDRISRLVTPLKPYEAMAMQRALVVSRVAALMEMIVEGETAVSFPPDDPVALADTIEPLLADPERRRRMGEAARDWVTRNRTWSQNGQRYRELYQRLGVA